MVLQRTQYPKFPSQSADPESTEIDQIFSGCSQKGDFGKTVLYLRSTWWICPRESYLSFYAHFPPILTRERTRNVKKDRNHESRAGFSNRIVSAVLIVLTLPLGAMVALQPLQAWYSTQDASIYGISLGFEISYSFAKRRGPAPVREASEATGPRACGKGSAVQKKVSREVFDILPVEIDFDIRRNARATISRWCSFLPILVLEPSESQTFRKYSSAYGTSFPRRPHQSQAARKALPGTGMEVEGKTHHHLRGSAETQLVRLPLLPPPTSQ
ncbi:hypothetical protein B0H14DRAFT_2605973 [Mycena olivaceomarginata]|nr:hypothetical protein B0H14DRAFT_2605973 [Mycena olivaceomarginata]